MRFRMGLLAGAAALFGLFAGSPVDAQTAPDAAAAAPAPCVICTRTVWVPDFFGKVFRDVITTNNTPGFAGPRVTFKQTTMLVSHHQCNPNSVAIAGGLLYIACTTGAGGLDEIVVYDATTLVFKKRFTSHLFNQLIAVAFDKHGNLWVSSYGNNLLLRVPKAHLAAASPAVDRAIVDSPDSPAGMAFASDGSLWVVGQFDGGIVLQFPDSVINQPGTFLATPLNPSPTACISNAAPGCQQVAGLFDNPEGVALFGGSIWVSNNGGNAPTGAIVRLKASATHQLTATVYGGGVGHPFSCPGGMFTLGTAGPLWITDEGYGVANTKCGSTGQTVAQGGDEGDQVGRVLAFAAASLASPHAPAPQQFTDWNRLGASSPGFGGIFVQ